MRTHSPTVTASIGVGSDGRPAWRSRDRAASMRAAVTIVLIGLVQASVCALAALPAALAWHALLARVRGPLARAVLVGVLALPTYVAFALTLLVISPLVIRLARARTPADAEMRIADMEWPLLRWSHYAAATHLVRVLAGTLFRGTPIWSAYLRLNGARVGRRVYVNSLHLADHNLLDIGDDVVIGSDAHVSGHTVEAGVLKTARVRIGAGATVGLGSVVEIGADVGAGCVVGALTLVPKYATLEPGLVYAGIPAHVLERHTGKAPPRLPPDGGG